MSRKNFAELVSYQIDNTAFSDLGTAINGAKGCLSPDIQLEIDEILKNSVEITADERFWKNDCGMVLRFFTTMVEKHLSDRFIGTTEKELIEIFHIIVMHCAYRAHKNPQMVSLLDKKTRRFRYKKAPPQQPSCHA